MIPMEIERPTPLLGGLSPAAFMRRHWQKKPLLVRGALADPLPGFDRRRLFALAAHDDVESRLVVRRGERWSLRPGPVPRRALPPLATPGWSPARARASTCTTTRRTACCSASASSPTRVSTTSWSRSRATAAASVRTSIPTTCSCSSSPGGGAADRPGGAPAPARRTCR
jgi:hypothetical protein